MRGARRGEVSNEVASSLATRDLDSLEEAESFARVNGVATRSRSPARDPRRGAALCGAHLRAVADVHAAFSFARVHPHSNGIAWHVTAKRASTPAASRDASGRRIFQRASSGEGDSSQGRFALSRNPNSRLFREIPFL